jgi:SAM-dependent methyltransferase
MADYVLRLSDEELGRYRMMAEMAEASEADAWQSAGIGPGAHVADVGCGPGAVLALLAARVGPEGRVAGVDADPEAVGHAEAAVADAPQATAQVGRADDTGLPAGAFDVAMCRHVLAHNGGGEGAIVDHLVGLVRPGGAVYLVDVDLTGLRIVPEHPAPDLDDRYRELLVRRGTDLMVGLRLGSYLEEAGLAVETYRCSAPVIHLPPTVRPPSWAARDALVEAGLADAADIARWDADFTASDAAAERPWLFAPAFVAVGRRPG